MADIINKVDIDELKLKKKKELRTNQNKRFYEKIKEEHKEKMRNYYHEHIKTVYINLYIFNEDDTLNRNLLSEFDEAHKKCEENKKYKIKFINKNII